MRLESSDCDNRKWTRHQAALQFLSINDCLDRMNINGGRADLSKIQFNDLIAQLTVFKY